jgi:thioredoxin-related protein
MVFLLVLFAWMGFALANPVEQTIQRALSENKPIAFYFKSQFCPYCSQVEDFVFSDEEVSKKLRNFLFVELDIRSEEGEQVGKKVWRARNPHPCNIRPKARQGSQPYLW